LILARNQNSTEIAVAASNHSAHRISVYSSDLVNKISPHLQRNLNKSEWDEYIGKDIPYSNTLSDLK